MLNIGKLGRDAAAYYLEHVARGVEDYYLHAGESPGRWMGADAAAVGIAGEVGDQQLIDLLGGKHPITGAMLAQARPGHERLPGYDLTFRAPKSVSLLFALGEGEVSREVKVGHEEAVCAALRYLERETAFSRRRVDGAIVPVRGEGLIAAAFQHRTSRAGDPLLHHHVLVANLVRDADGRWGALDGRLVYGHAKTAGYLYQAELRAQLTRRLGVRWTPVVRGTAEIEGIARDALRAFSRRRSEVLARMGERGEFSARAAQTATLDTRRAKDYAVSPEGLLPEWRRRAAALGLTADRLAVVVDPTARRSVGVSSEDFGVTMRALLSPTGLTAQASTFSRRDAVRATCELLPDADAEAIEHVVDVVLGTGYVVALDGAAHGAATRTRRDVPDQRRFTTVELLAIEREVVEGSLERNLRAERLLREASSQGLSAALNPGRAGGSAPVARRHLDAALSMRPSLSDEQRAMVERLTTGGDAVVVVRGHAGTGKTYALDTCRHAWEASGYRVVGCALSAQAAAELQAGSGITSTTIDRLLLDLAGGRRPVLPVHQSVLVVDEAGMVGTRLLERLLDRADWADAKVVLVGDDRQLPEIDAGGAFRGLCVRLGAVELTVNLRQREEWERRALRLVRDGRAEEALRAYLEHGRVVIGPSADAVRAQLVADWWSVEQREPGGAVMVALRRADVRELNERAHALRVAAGAVRGPEVELPTGAFGRGDRVVATRNARHLGVVNGSRATVVDLDERVRTVTVRLDSRRDEDPERLVALPGDYLDAGHLSYAYAVTGHKAQGMTASRAYVLGDETLYREWGYVALSRGREENRLYVVAGDSEAADDPTHGRRTAQAPSDAIWGLSQALRESRAQRLALDELEAGAAGAPPTTGRPAFRSVAEGLDDAQLRAAVRSARAVIDEPRPTPAARVVDRGAAIAELEATRDRLESWRGRLLHDIAGYQAELASTSGLVSRRRHRQQRAGREADISRATVDIEQLDHVRLPEITARLNTLHADEALAQTWRQRRDGAREWLAALDGEASSRIERRVHAAEAAPSAELCGNAPAALVEREAWRERVRAAETARLWRGGEATDPSVSMQRPDSGLADDQSPGKVRTPPDVAAALVRLREAEAAEQERSRLAWERMLQRRPAADHYQPSSFSHELHAAPHREGPSMSP